MENMENGIDKQTLLKEKLMQIIEDKPFTLSAKVAYTALNREDIENFFSDLLQHGCVSGMVGSLVYYYDTHAFFDEHYAEIEDLRNEWEESVGEPLKIENDLKNTLAWFGFEQTAWQIANQLGLEI